MPTHKELNSADRSQRPASAAAAVYFSDLPLAERMAETALKLPGDIFRAAVDRRDAKAVTGCIKDALGIIKEGDTFAAHEARMATLADPIPETPEQARIRELRAELAALEGGNGESRVPPKG